MTDYSELVEALRDTDFGDGCDYCVHWDMCMDNDCVILQAADAIEELQAKLEQCTLFNTNLLNMREMSKEEADEILEYIRNAPIGPIEPMQIEQLPKRGEWVERYDEDDKPFFKRKYVCSACGGWNTYGKSKYCPNCGAKMEVQDESDN